MSASLGGCTQLSQTLEHIPGKAEITYSVGAAWMWRPMQRGHCLQESATSCSAGLKIWPCLVQRKPPILIDILSGALPLLPWSALYAACFWHHCCFSQPVGISCRRPRLSSTGTASRTPCAPQFGGQQLMQQPECSDRPQQLMPHTLTLPVCSTVADDSKRLTSIRVPVHTLPTSQEAPNPFAELEQGDPIAHLQAYVPAPAGSEPVR